MFDLKEYDKFEKWCKENGRIVSYDSLYMYNKELFNKTYKNNVVSNYNAVWIFDVAKRAEEIKMELKQRIKELKTLIGDY